MCTFFYTHRITLRCRIGRVGRRAGLEVVDKRKFLTLPGFEHRLLRRPAHTQSLYWLKYPEVW
jgi:hypothetical protein